MLQQLEVGIDVSKDTLDVGVTRDGSRFFLHKVANTEAGFAQIWRRLESEESSPENWRIALEATSAYHRAFVLWFAEKGVKVLVMNPKQARDLARGLKILRKNDATDAKVLALCARKAWREPEALATGIAHELQELSRRIDVLTRLAADERRRAQKPGASPALLSSIERHRKLLLEEIARLERDWLSLLMDEERMHKAYSLALGVPGVGAKTARVVVSELYVTDRTRTPRECAAYAGLAPQECTSGISVRKPGRILTTGNKRLRCGLYMGALAAATHDRECRALYERVLAQGKPKKAAIAAVMNKTARRIGAVVARGTRFIRD